MKFRQAIPALVATTLVLTQLSPRPAHAVVGAFTGGAALPAAAFVLGLTTVGMLVGYPIGVIQSGMGGGRSVLNSTAVVTSIGLALGILLLDEQDRPVGLMQLTEEQAKKANLTEAEYFAYENEREEIAVVAQDLGERLASGALETQHAWDGYEGTLTLEARRAVGKLLRAQR
jgi:hypothetical protein